MRASRVWWHEVDPILDLAGDILDQYAPVTFWAVIDGDGCAHVTLGWPDGARSDLVLPALGSDYRAWMAEGVGLVVTAAVEHDERIAQTRAATAHAGAGKAALVFPELAGDFGR
jgi:hypothetical protein